MYGRGGVRSVLGKGREVGPEYYDGVLRRPTHYLKQYTASSRYFLFAVIVDRLRGSGCGAVLEVGCGTGQLACAIRDAGVVEDYCGFDFSPGRVRQARAVCPGFRFEVGDAYSTDLFDGDGYGYDVVLATEVLEHLSRDLDVVRRIRGGSRFLATVPNFGAREHIRFFEDEEKVAERYSPMFGDLRVDRFAGNGEGRAFFLLDGIRVGG